MSKMTSEAAFDVVTSLIVGGDIDLWQVQALQYILNENARLREALSDIRSGYAKYGHYHAYEVACNALKE